MHPLIRKTGNQKGCCGKSLWIKSFNYSAHIPGAASQPLFLNLCFGDTSDSHVHIYQISIDRPIHSHSSPLQFAQQGA
jgi:hypothetical protein